MGANDASLISIYFYTWYCLTDDYFAHASNITYNSQSYHQWLECKMTITRSAWGICKGYSKYKHKDHVQGVAFYTFPRSVMEDKNHLKITHYRQWIKACARPDHQLNMEMIIKDIIVKRNYHYKISFKVSVYTPTHYKHAVHVLELSFYVRY